MPERNQEPAPPTTPPPAPPPPTPAEIARGITDQLEGELRRRHLTEVTTDAIRLAVRYWLNANTPDRGGGRER